MVLRRLGMCVADDENSGADDGNSKPAHRRNSLAQHEVRQQGDQDVGRGRSGLDIAIVRPGEDYKVGNEIGEEKSDSNPDGTSGESTEEEMKQMARRPTGHWGKMLHSLAKKHVAEGGDGNHDYDQSDGFEVEALRRRHAPCDSPTPELASIGGTVTSAFLSTPLRARETLMRSARSFMKSTAS